jgi:hypothetical protein
MDTSQSNPTAVLMSSSVLLIQFAKKEKDAIETISLETRFVFGVRQHAARVLRIALARCWTREARVMCLKVK